MNNRLNEPFSEPLHGRAMALPLWLTRQVARAFAEHPFVCIARTDDGRPIILAHDLEDGDRLRAGLPRDVAEYIAIHAGHYVDDHGQVLQPSKGQYMLLAAGTSPAGTCHRPRPAPRPAPEQSTDNDYLLVGFLPATAARAPRDPAQASRRPPSGCASYDISGRHQMIELDDPDDPRSGGNFADARARADRLVESGDYWAVAIRRRGDATRRWAYFATESRAPLTAGTSK